MWPSFKLGDWRIRLTKKKRILVVDDERINLEFFEVMLSKLGFDVHTATDGQQALDAIKRLKPDLVLLDNIMPKLSGWEVTKTIKSSPAYASFADTPIIMFSALDDVKDKVEGLELGAEDYITKPFNFSEVLARVRVALRSHELVNRLHKQEERLSLCDQDSKELSMGLSEVKALLAGISQDLDIDAAKTIATQTIALIDRLESKSKTLRAKADILNKEAQDLKTIETEKLFVAT